MEQGRYAEAEKLFRELLTTQQKVLPEDHPQISFTTINLAVSLHFQQKTADAEKLHRELLVRLRQLGATEAPLR